MCLEESNRLTLKSHGDYETRRTELNLKTLEHRRFIADVTFLYKVLNGYLNLDISSLLNFHSLEDHTYVHTFFIQFKSSF